MKLLARGGATATLSLLLCSGFAQAADFSKTSTVVPPAQPEAKTQPVPDIARILPSNTPYTIMLSTKSELWGSLNRFALFKMAGDYSSQFIPKGLNGLNFDYQRDIQSQLGDQVGLVFLPKLGNATVKTESNFVMVASVKNQQTSQSWLNQLKANSQDAKFEDYKGVKILNIKTDSDILQISNPVLSLNSTKPIKKAQGFSIAALPGYIVAGETNQPIEQLIDSIQTNTDNLAENPKFQQTYQNPQATNALVSVYVNPTTFLPLAQDLAKDPSLPFPIIGAENFNSKEYQKLGTINGFVTSQPEGLRVQFNVHQSQSQFPHRSQNKGAIVSRLPAATYTSLTGEDLNTKWQILTTALNTKPEYKKGLGEFRQYVRSTTGLDFDRDVMSWMNGEYAFFFFPTKGGLFKLFNPNSNMGIGLAVETNNHTAADASLKKLSNFIKSMSKGQIEVNTHTLKGKTVTSWDVPGGSANSLFAYSWLDDKTLIVSSGLGAIADLVPQPNVSLPAAYNFTTATNSLPHPNEGYFYMNMGSLMSWVYGFFPSQSNDKNYADLKQAIGSVYSISSTTTTKPDQEQLDFLLVLAPNRNNKNK